MKKYLVITALGMSLMACQKSDSGKANDDSGAATQKSFQKELEGCRALKGTPKLVGKWHFSQSTNGFTDLSEMDFKGSEVTLTVTTQKDGVICSVGGSAPYQDLKTAFRTLEVVKNSNSKSSADGKYQLDCNVHMPADTYQYSFNGGCLVINTPGGNYEFAPSSYPNDSTDLPPSKEEVPSAPVPTEPGGQSPAVGERPVGERPVQPVPVQPTPSEPPTSGFSSVVQEVCDSYASHSQKLDCFDHLKDLRQVDPIVADVCRSYAAPSAKEACLKEIGRAKVQKAVAEICIDQASPTNQQSCIRQFDSVMVDERFIPLCQQYQSPSQRISCLQSHKM